MNVVLIPGFWLDASSWDAVTPVLEQAGTSWRASRPPEALRQAPWGA
jgi:hypothetical protein